MSDELDLLPVNKMAPFDPTEAGRLRPYLASGHGWSLRTKFLLVVGGFALLSVPFIDQLLTRITGNTYITFVLKTILFAIALYVVYKQ